MNLIDYYFYLKLSNIKYIIKRDIYINVNKTRLNFQIFQCCCFVKYSFTDKKKRVDSRKQLEKENFLNILKRGNIFLLLFFFSVMYVYIYIHKCCSGDGSCHHLLTWEQCK